MKIVVITHLAPIGRCGDFRAPDISTTHVVLIDCTS
jgi:hypothetical protein